MKRNLRQLSEEELLLVAGGMRPRDPDQTARGGKPPLNASQGPAGRLMKPLLKGVVIEAGINAAKAVGQAIKNHQFQNNPTPVADRNHRWLN